MILSQDDLALLNKLDFSIQPVAFKYFSRKRREVMSFMLIGKTILVMPGYTHWASWTALMSLTLMVNLEQGINSLMRHGLQADSICIHQPSPREW